MFVVAKKDPWSPYVIPRSVLRAWWNVDDHGTALMTDDGSGVISSWSDRIGGLAITAATTARPTWAAASFNSAYAGITFDGVANCFVTTTLTSLPTAAVPGEIWMLCANTDPTSTSECTIRYGGTAAATVRNVGAFTSASIIRYSLSDFQTSIIDTSTVFTGYFVTGAAWDATTEYGFINGAPTAPASAVLATGLNTSTTRLRVGANTAATAAAFWGGLIRHVFVTTALGTADRQRLEGWMAWDVALNSLLPTTHPYRYVRP